MSAIDRLLAANARRDEPTADPETAKPQQQLAVLTCMDTRIDPYRALGLMPGDAHLIRNAGAVITDDAIRSLVLAQHELGVRELAVIAHTRCGVLGLDEDRLRSALEAETGAAASTPARFEAFDDLDEHVRAQLGRVRAHPWLQPLTARGFVYDVETGRLREVNETSG